jgi:hypothetical protein
MPHPYDHPAVARAITRSLPNRSRRPNRPVTPPPPKQSKPHSRAPVGLLRHRLQAQAPRVPSAPVPIVERRSLPAKEEGWAEVVVDNRRRRWR